MRLQFDIDALYERVDESSPHGGRIKPATFDEYALVLAEVDRVSVEALEPGLQD